ncbi:hypothetical protein MBLNU13_g05474t1 [Cladosporium sp. NU13]
MPSDTRRDARSTRDSDATGTTTPRGHDKEKTKSKGMNGTLDGWVEPSLAAKPSFEDHGGAPYGVLEHMQPLGEPPSTRVRARVKGDGARKSLLGKGGAGAGLDAQETPEGTPGPQSSQTALESLPPLPLVPMDDSDDDDYAPGKKSKKKEKGAKPRGAKRQSETAGSSAEAPPSGKGKGRGKKVVEKTPKAAEKPAPAPAQAPERININRIYYPEKLKAVVDEARRRAIESGKKSLAEAVEEIHTQSLTNQHLTTLLEAILCQNATPAQTAEFQVYVKQAKKKLRLAKAEAAGKSPAAEVNGTKPLPAWSPVKEETVAQVKQELPTAPVTEKAAIPKPKFSIKVKSPPKQISSNQTSQSSSPVKHKTEDMDNDSDLSELTELSEGEEMAVDTPEERDEMSAAPPQLSNGTKAKDQAAERGSLGVQGGNLKRSSADAEIQETEDDRVLSAKKLKLSGKLTRDYDYTDSHIRSSLSGLSRGVRGPGAKNGAASTPRITLQPNGSGNASARSSRAISLDAESPLSSPAGSSRRSTPGHVWKGPPKQTGKRAKTKTS